MDFWGFQVIEGRGWDEKDSFAQYKLIANQAFLNTGEAPLKQPETDAL